MEIKDLSWEEHTTIKHAVELYKQASLVRLPADMPDHDKKFVEDKFESLQAKIEGAE